MTFSVGETCIYTTVGGEYVYNDGVNPPNPLPAGLLRPAQIVKVLGGSPTKYEVSIRTAEDDVLSAGVITLTNVEEAIPSVSTNGKLSIGAPDNADTKQTNTLIAAIPPVYFDVKSIDPATGVNLGASDATVLESKVMPAIDPGMAYWVQLGLMLRNSDLLSQRVGIITLQAKIGAAAYVSLATFPRSYSLAGPLNLVTPPERSPSNGFTVPNTSGAKATMQFRALGKSTGGTVLLAEGSLSVLGVFAIAP